MPVFAKKFVSDTHFSSAVVQHFLRVLPYSHIGIGNDFFSSHFQFALRHRLDCSVKKSFLFHRPNFKVAKIHQTKWMGRARSSFNACLSQTCGKNGCVSHQDCVTTCDVKINFSNRTFSSFALVFLLSPYFVYSSLFTFQARFCFLPTKSNYLLFFSTFRVPCTLPGG